MRRAIILDDGLAPLSPLTDLRPAFDVRTGALTTLERLVRTLDLDVAAMIVPDEIAGVTREAHDKPVNELPGGEESMLVVSGRCVVAPDEILAIGPGQVLVEDESGETIAACLSPGDIMKLHAGESLDVERIDLARTVLLHRPWDVIRLRNDALAIDLRLLRAAEKAVLPDPCIRIGDQPLSVEPSARLYPGITLDTEHGPIWIGARAVVRPGATIIGPAAIGEGSTVLDKALIKPQTAIGPACKVAGEVGGTIFQGFANKAHDGHLGDSWVGEWVNLGAGTTNSNLLNTYGEVTACAAPGMSNEPTGMQFLGAIIGDHVKTAISSRIMTGAVVHTGVMWAAGAPMSGCVERLAWVTDGGRQTYRMERFLDVARVVMGRRGVEMGEAYTGRIEELHNAGEGKE